MARTALNDLFTTAFPADCCACGGPLLRAGTVPVCDVCLESPAPQTRTLCRRCGEAIRTSLDIQDIRFAGMLPEGLLCTPCRTVPPDFTRAVAYTEYRDETRTLIHLLKYEGVRGVAPRLGSLLAKTISSLRGEAGAELLVIAVPLFAAKQRQRGYNQSVLLADAALQQLKRNDPQWKLTAAHALLRRVRHTEDQYSLSPKGRRRNLRGAFKITDKDSVSGREVLLIDDIFTTGTTARECARVLARAGAAKVWVTTVARAQVGTVEMFENEFAADSSAWGSPHWEPASRPPIGFVSTELDQPSIEPTLERRM